MKPGEQAKHISSALAKPLSLLRFHLEYLLYTGKMKIKGLAVPAFLV